jgi:UDP-glucose 4-epimerase
MKAMVTGGAGFIGSHLVDRLLAEGYTVDVIDDLSHGSLANVAEARNDHTGAFRFHNLDARSRDLSELVGRRAPQVIFHMVDVPEDNDRNSVDVLVTTCVNVLEAAKEHNVGKVVVTIDALALYGNPLAADLPLRDGQPAAPTTSRGIAMRTIVDLCKLYRTRHAVEFTVIALVNVFGPRQRPERGVAAAFVERAARGQTAEIHGDGRQTRDLLYVDDAVDALVRSAVRGGGLVVNVGTGVQTSVRQLERMVMGEVPAATRKAARPEDIARFAVSPVRARIHLAWAPWTSVAEGVARLTEALPDVRRPEPPSDVDQEPG